MAYKPKTLLEAIVYYSDPETCHKLIVSVIWPHCKGEAACRHCGVVGARYMKTVQRYKCYSCRKQFSIKVGTILEDSKLPLTKWLPAFWLIVNAKNGISSCELARALGNTQKSAWFVLHRIRYVLTTEQYEMLRGIVEVDESFLGGLEKFKHKNKKLHAGTGGVGKSVVLAFLQRGSGDVKRSKVVSKVIVGRNKETLQGHIKQIVEPGSTIYTDAFKSYQGLSEKYVHDFVDHALEYVKGKVSTNGIENFFCHLKRTMKGTYTKCEPFHLARYIDEQSFRHNHCDLNDSQRFAGVMNLISGKRLRYRELTKAYVAYYDQVMPRSYEAAESRGH